MFGIIVYYIIILDIWYDHLALNILWNSGKLAALSENDPQSALEIYEDISYSSSGNDRGTLTGKFHLLHFLLIHFFHIVLYFIF